MIGFSAQSCEAIPATIKQQRPDYGFMTAIALEWI
jgi:hypothetical protein